MSIEQAIGSPTTVAQVTGTCVLDAYKAKQAASIVKNACYRNSNSLPVLQCIKVKVESGKAVFAATDLSISCEYVMEAVGNCLFLVNAKALEAVLKPAKRGSTVTFTVNQDKLSVSLDGVTSTLELLSPEDYPILPSDSQPQEELKITELEGAYFAHTISTVTSVCMDEKDARSHQALTKACFRIEQGKLYAIGTNGHILVRKELPLATENTQDQDILIPAQALEKFTKYIEKARTASLTVQVKGEKKFAVLQTDEWILYNILEDFPFPPDISSLLNKKNELSLRLDLDLDELQEALQRVKATLDPNTHKVTFAPEGISTENENGCSTKVQLVSGIPPVTIAWRWKYLDAIAKAFAGFRKLTPLKSQSPKITFWLKDSQSMAIIEQIDMPDMSFALMSII